MGNFANLNQDIPKILLKIIGNEKLAKLIYYTDEDINSKPPVPKPSSLLYSQVYPYFYVPEINKEAKTFLCIRFPKVEKGNKNPYYQYTNITFYAICHKNLVKTKEGMRYFCMLDEIDDMVNNGEFKKLGWISNGDPFEVTVNQDYVGYAYPIKVCDSVW